MPHKDPEERRLYFKAHDRKPHRRAAHRNRWREYPVEYKIWVGMVRGCRERPDYIDRGVCARWRRSFAAFLADMGPRPSRRHTLERKRNSEGYSPGNCKWATPQEQQRNKCDNRIIRVDGRAHCVTAWSEEYGLNPRVVFQRLDYGWSPAAALKTPVREYGNGRT